MFLSKRVHGLFLARRREILVRCISTCCQSDNPMIRCLPKGICSWDFLLEGDGHRADLHFDLVREQGSMTADDTPYGIHKHGLFSGEWTLDRAGQGTVASAIKSSAFSRTFEVRHSLDSLLLRAESMLSRSFRVERSGLEYAKIITDHAFTRRATIEVLSDAYHFPTVGFAFWLVVLVWRRAASSSS